MKPQRSSGVSHHRPQSGCSRKKTRINCVLWAGLGLNAGLLKHHFKGRTQCPIATTPGATQQKTLNAHLVPINAELCHVCGSFAAILVPAIRHMIHGFETTILRPTNVQQLQTRPCFHPSRVAVGIIMKAPGNKPGLGIIELQN